MTDELIGKYKVLRSIGAGGMATVFLAAHRDVPNLKTVLKKLSDPKLADRFKREADKLALLDGHAGICQIKHFFEFEGDFYIVMEYIEGPTLDQLIKGDDPPDLDRALQLTASMLATLGYAHCQGIVHRDIKPSNIMLDRIGQLKIIDFGVAKGAADPDLTQVGTSLGSPRYMAPEQFNPQGPIDWVRCDLYAVGVTLYYLLAHRVPFDGKDIYEVCDAKRQGDVVPPSRYNPAISPALDAVVLKAMNRNPERRYASAVEMQRALENINSATPPVATPEISDRTMVLGDRESPPPAPPPAPAVAPAVDPTPQPLEDTPTPTASPGPAPRGRRRIYIGAAVVLAVALLGTAGIIGLRGGGGSASREPEPTPAPLLPLALLAPAEGAELKGPEVAFRWDTAGDSLGVFTLQYGTDAAFASSSPSTRSQGGQYRPEEKLTPGTYYWRVRRGPPDRLTGPWSAVNAFKVVAPPAPTKRPATPPARPKPAVSKGSVTIGLRMGETNMMTEAALLVDGKRREFSFPGSIELTTGRHELSAVLVYNGQEWKASESISIAANSKKTLLLVLERSD